MNIYIAKNGTQTGPYSEEQIHGMLTGGLISRNDSAWHDGVPDWQPISILLGLHQPPLLPIIPALATNPTQIASGKPDGPTGIAGWLLFFCISLTILSPLLSFGQVMIFWDQSKKAIDAFPLLKGVFIWENFGLTALSIYGFVVGCIIWSGSLQGRKIAKMFLLINFFGFIGVEAIAIAMMSDLPARNFAAGQTGVFKSVLQGFINFQVWWFYFKNSKRVRNTYGNESAQPCIVTNSAELS